MTGILFHSGHVEESDGVQLPPIYYVRYLTLAAHVQQGWYLCVCVSLSDVVSLQDTNGFGAKQCRLL